MRGVRRIVLMGAMLVLVLGAVVPGVDAAGNRGTLTVMTQNIYQGTEFDNSVQAQNLQEFLQGVALDYANMEFTNWPERADALAGEITKAAPAVVGLQEVALWQTSPVDASGHPTGPWTVTYDFLQILMDRLAAHGAHYAVEVSRTNFSLDGDGLFGSGLLAVHFDEKSALLVRTDLPDSEFHPENPQAGGYQAYVGIPTFDGSTVPVHGGWLSVDVTTRGNTFRFITTHLTQLNASFGVQPQQMAELLAGPAATSMPVVIAGDFNSTSIDPAYTEAIDAGFVDQWPAADADASALTCCQVLPTINNTAPALHTRIDHIMARGPITTLGMYRVGALPSSRTPSGFYPSDHAGLVANMRIRQ